MSNVLKIAGYCRISVDEELDRDNTSIENQKALITDYVTRTFPDAHLDFYADRDRSGYTFEQRENYQELRRKLFRHEYDILVIKDFSRFSRRTSRGLVELEDLRDAGMRIISVGDGIDFPTSDDWMAIQFRFLVNEMPVTDTSKKVRAVISNRQKEGKWICAVPYGYVMTGSKAMKFAVDEPSAEVVRKIFQLYSEGWGYRKIANYLTDLNIPTPRRTEEMRREAKGEEYTVRSKDSWSIISVSTILSNDFYIGTLRQRKYRRKKINGGDIKLSETDHIVIENDHEPVVDNRLFAAVQEQMKSRSRNSYRGVKKFDNVYTGHLFCGDCGSPMFAMSRADIPQAYRCGTYHKRGIKGCTSHHIRVDVLNELLRSFIRKVRDNSDDMLSQLQKSVDREQKEHSSGKNTVDVLTQRMEDAKTEMKFLSRQHVKDIARHPGQEEMLEEVYQEQVSELMKQIEGLRSQIQLAADRHSAMSSANRTAKTVMEVFDAIINKEKLTKNDVDFIVERIDVFEDHIDVKLRSDIDALLRTGADSNFQQGTKITGLSSLFAHIPKRKGEILSVSVVSDGDPLEIYTNSEGEVIFKKYSAVSEMSENAGYVAEIMHKIAGCPVVIFDKDHVVATAGVPRKEFSERRVTGQLEELMENRGQFFCPDGSTNNFFPAEGVDRTAIAALPIITAGDVSGAVAFLSSEKCTEVTDLQKSLINAAAQFLARQIEG